jgi:hypothetical protein
MIFMGGKKWLLKTFLDANPDRQESVHCDFLTTIVAGISPHVLRLFNDFHGRKKSCCLRLF